MAVKKFSTDSSIKNSFKLSRGATSVAKPDAPTIGAVAAGATPSTQVTVAYTAATLGAAASTFTATSTPSSLTGTGSSPITVSGLSPSTSYTFTVKASNANGDSLASAASSSITTSAIPNSYESIATVTVGGAGQNTVTFSSISASYTHLQIRWIARENTGSVSTPDENVRIRFNSDTGGNYSLHRLNGNGSTTSADGYANESDVVATGFSGNSATAGIYGAGIIDILDYANTNKYKTVRLLSGVDQNGSGAVWFNSGNWRNTNAITSIELRESTNGFKQYTQFALYGIKGA